MSNVTRLDPNGPEPVTVLENALDNIEDFAEVIVLGFRPGGGFVLYGSKGVDDVAFARAAIKYLNEMVEQDF